MKEQRPFIFPHREINFEWDDPQPGEPSAGLAVNVFLTHPANMPCLFLRAGGAPMPPRQMLSPVSFILSH